MLEEAFEFDKETQRVSLFHGAALTQTEQKDEDEKQSGKYMNVGQRKSKPVPGTKSGCEIDTY